MRPIPTPQTRCQLAAVAGGTSDLARLHNQKTGGLHDSLREDISKEKVSERARRVKGAKFLWLNPEWIEELDAIRDIVKKALANKGEIS